MENAKRKRGRPPKRKVMEFEGMTYEGTINNALDKEVRAELDDTLAHKDEDELTDDERKSLKRRKEKKSYTLNVRFTESEMQDTDRFVTILTARDNRSVTDSIRRETALSRGRKTLLNDNRLSAERRCPSAPFVMITGKVIP